MDEIVLAKEQQEEIMALWNKMHEFSQPRSNYALRTHVICTHDTPERQYKQLLDELWARLDSLQQLTDEYESTSLDLEEAEEKLHARQGGLPYDHVAEPISVRRQQIEIRKLQRKLLRTRYALEGTTREVKALLDLKREMKDYTWNDFEQAEPGYWTLRLVRQWMLNILGNGGAGNQGNLDAIMNLFTPLDGYRPALGTLENAVKALGFDLESGRLPSGEVGVQLTSRKE